MNAKQFAHTTKIMEELKQLDKEIIAIDQLALKVANGEGKCKLRLSMEEPKEDVALDNTSNSPWYEMKTAIMDAQRTAFYIGFDEDAFKRSIGSKPSTHHQIENELSENATLQILGVLLGEKQMKRIAIIGRLKDYGVTV